jgi:hypothetical protein
LLEEVRAVLKALARQAQEPPAPAVVVETRPDPRWPGIVAVLALLAGASALVLSFWPRIL